MFCTVLTVAVSGCEYSASRVRSTNTVARSTPLLVDPLGAQLPGPRLLGAQQSDRC